MTTSTMSAQAPAVLLFDGVCNLCAGVVQWVIGHDPYAKVKFASLQSKRGQHLARAYGVDSHVDSLVLIVGGHAFTYSGAALRLAGLLGYPWKLAMVGLVVPRPLRDGGYRFLAAHRYAWFGRKQECWLPTPQLRTRFVVDGT